MSEYPKKLVSEEGGVAIVNDAKDEATLKATGYKDSTPSFHREAFMSPPAKAKEEKPKLRGRPKRK